MMDSRNVKDEYKNLPNSEIKSLIREKSFGFAIMMSHIRGDYNFGSIIRSANAFGAEKVFYYGKKKFDPRLSCGVKNYTDVIYLSNFEDILKLKKEYSFVGLEQHHNSIPLFSFDWKTDKTPLIIIGEESQGLQEDVLKLCDYIVEIQMFGSVRSLNAAVSGSIAMSEFVRRQI